MALLLSADSRLVLRILATSPDDSVARRLGEALAVFGTADAGAERALAEGALRSRLSGKAEAPYLAVVKQSQAAEDRTVEVTWFATSSRAAEVLAQSLAFDGLVFSASADDGGDGRRLKALAGAASGRKERASTWRLAVLGARPGGELESQARGLGPARASFHPRPAGFDAVKALVRDLLAECQQGTRPMEVA